MIWMLFWCIVVCIVCADVAAGGVVDMRAVTYHSFADLVGWFVVFVYVCVCVCVCVWVPPPFYTVTFFM